MLIDKIRDTKPDVCVTCGNSIKNKRRQYYCSDLCKWNDRFYASAHPAKQRTHLYFNCFLKAGLGGKGQGKRSRGMVTGAMSSNLNYQHCLLEVTEENLRLHADRIKKAGVESSYRGIRLGNGQMIKNEDIPQLLQEIEMEKISNAKTV